jgi:hypothetical protein
MSRQNEDHQLSSPYFCLAFCQKLRISCVPTGTCLYGTPVDPLGDFYFQSASVSKDAMHNHLCDTVQFIMSELGPHAGIISSRRDVWKEPVNLDQHSPTCQPADVCLNLRPTYVCPPAAPFQRAAIDVTVTSPLPLLSTGGDPSTYTESVTHHHEEAERVKFRGRSSVNTDRSYVRGSQVIRALNNSNTVLKPFTFDPLGGYGPTVAKTLFGSSPAPDRAPLNFHSDAVRVLLTKLDVYLVLH